MSLINFCHPWTIPLRICFGFLIEGDLESILIPIILKINSTLTPILPEYKDVSVVLIKDKLPAYVTIAS